MTVLILSFPSRILLGQFTDGTIIKRSGYTVIKARLIEMFLWIISLTFEIVLYIVHCIIFWVRALRSKWRDWMSTDEWFLKRFDIQELDKHSRAMINRVKYYIQGLEIDLWSQ